MHSTSIAGMQFTAILHCNQAGACSCIRTVIASAYAACCVHIWHVLTFLLHVACAVTGAVPASWWSLGPSVTP